jgi:hypothetical protein
MAPDSERRAPGVTVNTRIDALWAVQFASITHVSAGVVVFASGHAVGGDARYYYLGQYEFAGSEIEAAVRVRYYAGQPYSIFGYRTQFLVELRGRLKEDGTIFCHGHIRGEPESDLAVEMTRLVSFPAAIRQC